ncbi:MAG: hypothetical protein EP329_07480, partial [Deltaproteobacteria bacterium]
MRTTPFVVAVVALVAVSAACSSSDKSSKKTQDTTGDITAEVDASDGGDTVQCGAEGAACDDGDPCTVGDQCQGDVCVGGSTLSCDDPDPCTVGRCQAGVGCVYDPVADGESCTLSCFGAASCQGGACTPDTATAKACPESSDPCIDRFACDMATGECSVPVYRPAGAACDLDDDVCTLDTCDGDGACTASGGVETCSTENQNNPCWTYVCNKKNGCAKTLFLEGASCDDHNGCTSNDTCGLTPAGQQACIGTLLPIDDLNPCTDDKCVDGTVSHDAIDGIVCSVATNLCASIGLCASGVCQPQINVDCDDDDPCTADACDPATGACVHPAAPGNLACDDGNACTSNDTCAAGQCVGQAIAGCCGNGVCEAGEACGCADCEGLGCDDGDACTTGDHCGGGQCIGAAVANCCGNGVCEAGETCGCVADCDGESCDDGQSCTDGDHCDAGQCVGTLLASCCGNGTCDPGEGCGCADCDGESCDDGSSCTDNDVCTGGQCVGTGLDGCCGNGVCESGERCGCVADCQGESCGDDPCVVGATCQADGSCGGGTPTATCCGDGACEGAERCGCVDDCLDLACDDLNADTSDDRCRDDGACRGDVDAIPCGSLGVTATGGLGEVVLSGTIVIDTSAGTITANGVSMVDTGMNGVSLVTQQTSGLPWTAPAVRVFDFTTLTIAAGSTVDVQGSNALALLATGNITLGGTFDLAGGNGTAGGTNSGGSAGSAGPGGTKGGAWVSGPGCASGNGKATGPGAGQ